jgi:hypothetical protein
MRAPFLLLALTVAGAATAAEPPLAPFTPAADLKGSWAFSVNPALPNVLILGDSISMAYTRDVRDLLAGKANVFRPMQADGRRPMNCGETRMGLQHIDAWLGDQRWSVIHFNWGLWDLCYRHPDSKTQGNRDKVKGALSVPQKEYRANLEQLVLRLKATGAKLIWASTTAVPEGEAGRFAGDEVTYNAIARDIMARHGVATNDLHAITKGFGGRHSAGPADVHFTPEGSRILATAVAESVARTLP